MNQKMLNELKKYAENNFFILDVCW